MDYDKYLNSDDYELVLIRAPKNMDINKLNRLDINEDAIATIGTQFDIDEHHYTIRQSEDDISAQYLNLFPQQEAQYKLGKAFASSYVINERFEKSENVDPKSFIVSPPCAHDLSKLEGPLFK